MKIVIAGAGEVGSHLGKLLSREEQDIVMIDNDREKLDRLDANYNLMTCVGSPTSFRTLSNAGVDTSCDLFIAVTPYENTNITSCAIAKSLGARKTVARIDNYEFRNTAHRPFFASIGVDHLIYPEYLAAQEICTALKRPWVRHWFELNDGRLLLIGVKIRSNASLVGKSMRDITATQHNYHVAAIKRRHETIIPRGDDVIQADDILYFTTTEEFVDDIRDLCGKRDYKVRNVMVMGGSRIAVRLAHMASDRLKLTIIENDPDICRRLPEKCSGCDVRIIHGDARNNDVLREEGIGAMDAFVALTDASETNILTCLAAKEMGVNKTIAEVENIQFISEAEILNIGTIVNKKLLASSKIFQLLLDADETSSRFMALSDAEVAELEARPGSKITRAPVMDLRLSRDMTIAGLIRNGRGMLVGGRDRIEAGDHVLVFCLSGSIHKVEKLFI
ncbi:MAG TPA: Trk system potassium transporter TrkA [Porphyromonadaceae bacterium]|nr:Trk system potassium transporter TrkA [Muribaculaceae bacterium Isolate-013 (NCI)]HAP28488.1 Trk system potassium transporter TrkA [Porphyromonadaceae bacterium]